MKTNKVTKLGVSLLSVAVLGVVVPALTDVPVFGVSIVKADENQEPLKYRIDYLDADTGEIMFREHGVLNSGETINIHKKIDGYEVVSKYSWMPGFNVDYRIMDTYFGSSDGYLYMFLRYKKVNADAKPSDTPKPEVKPETKPSETPKPEVKPEPAPKDEEKQEPLKYRITYYDIETRETLGQMTGVINPGQTINIYKKFNGHEIISKDEWMPNYDMTYDIVNEYFYRSADGYDDLRLEYKKVEEPTPTPTPEPEVKPETKPSDTPKPEVKPEPAPTPTPTPEPAPTPTPTPEPEVKPETKPSETPEPEVKPEPKPSETPKPEVKPAPKPSDTPKPEVKPEPKPSDTSKPEVKPAPKPSDTSKPEVKPELKPQTNSNTAPTAPVKPVGQTSNSKADKPTSKKETPALPNTGEQSSSLSLIGLLLASLGLAGLTYKGRH